VPSHALFTDLYELTMLQAYHEAGLHDEAVFSLFVRNLPPSRNYMIAAGLEEALTYLENLRFSDQDIAYLASLGQFSPGFLAHLKTFRFEGDVYAMPEGSLLFAQEPILEIIAPIGQGQLIETYVMNQAHLQTLLATKAARVVQAAEGRAVFDFGARRIHGVDAAMKAARASYIAGVAGTSNVAAAQAYGLPAAGTMAHSYIESFDTELDAFRAFARSFPRTTLLVDTYDTLGGVRRVIDLAKELGDDFHVNAIRLDSGDLAELAKGARRLLNEAGLQGVAIFASGGLDEYKIAELVAAGAPIDAFGAGTAMGVSADAPSLDIVYKLTEYAGRGRIKLSPGKAIYPGRKQLFRQEKDGRLTGDVIARADERHDGQPMLRLVMRRGQRVAPAPALQSIRERAACELAKLPPELHSLSKAQTPYPVEISRPLEAYKEAVATEIGHTSR
jgi:nicotinate phosphoribosyltransferase